MRILKTVILTFLILKSAAIKHSISSITMGNDYTDKEFIPFIESFKRLNRVFKGKEKHIVPIVFDNFYDDYYQDENIAAVCYKYALSPNYIVVNRKVWKTFTKKQRQFLIMHELGHCSYDKEHEKGTKDDGCPKSIMHTHIPSDYCASTYYTQYIIDFFTQE